MYILFYEIVLPFENLSVLSLNKHKHKHKNMNYYNNYRKEMTFQPYNRETLLGLIDQIEITRVDNQVITKWKGVVTSIENVSRIYEVFDIKKYINDKIELIEKNFEIKEFYFSVTKGVQQLKLISDSVTINGVEFHKAFFILNSSDRSRKLNFNSGLYSKSDHYYMVSTTQNLGLCKKHYRGVTQAAEEASKEIDVETFDEQIESIQKLVGHKVAFSKLRDIFMENVDKKTPKINHKKFDNLKISMLHSLRRTNDLTADVAYMLRRTSEFMKEVPQEKDFYLDAFTLFQVNMKLYAKLDSHLVKNETERILGITQWAVRNDMLAELLLE